jgi:hypothetical protein
MATAHFAGSWDMKWRSRWGFPLGYILFKVDDFSLPRLRKVMDRLARKQEEKGELYDLDVDITIHYQKRSGGQNALMWALYTVLADLTNEGIDHEGATADSLYQEDMKKLAPAKAITVRLEDVEDLPQFGVKVRDVVPIGNGMCRAWVYKTSSDFDTLQMHRHIEYLFNRIAARGVPMEQSSDIERYWLEWRHEINRKKLVLHDATVSADEYREANPICEATGIYIGPTQAAPNGSGHRHHIKSQGAGGAEPERDIPENWLMLSPEAHNEWEALGVEGFIKKYPHLENKIRKALKEG